MKPFGVQIGNAKPVHGAGLGLGAFMRPAGNTAPGGNTGPTIPPFTDFVLSAGLFNLNPVGYGGGAVLRNTNIQTSNFLLDSPYLPNYSSLTGFEINRLNDQSASANRFNAGTGNPSLILTSPTVVAGAGTAGANGALTYFGQTNERYSAVYEGSTDPGAEGVYWNGTDWLIRRFGDSQYSSTDDVPYPWLVTTWVEQNGALPVPTVTQGTPDTAIIGFDGVDDQLVTTSPVFSGGSQQGTIYVYYKDNTGSSNGALLQLGDDVSAVEINLSGGTIIAEITSATSAVNSKEYAVPDTNWHFVAFGFDTTKPIPEEQTVLYIDGVESTTTGSAGDINSELVGDYVGTTGLNIAGNRCIEGQVLGWAVKNVLDTPAQMEAMRLWVEGIPK